MTMTKDALTPYRMDYPLTQDELAFLQMEPLKTYLKKVGGNVQQQGEGVYLVVECDNNEQLLLRVLKIASNLQRISAPLYLITASFSLALRLSLNTMDDVNHVTLNCLSTLSFYQRESGQTEKGLINSRKALAMAYELDGDHSHKIPFIVSNIANCLNNLNQPASAMALIQHTLDRMQDNHEEYALLLYNLALTLRNLNLIASAIPLFKKALKNFERDFKKALEKFERDRHYKRTLSCANALDTCLSETGQLEQALLIHQKTLVSCRAILGENHPQTLCSIHNLGCTLYNLGQFTSAIPLFEEALEYYEEHNEDYESILSCANALATCLSETGQHEQALLIRQKKLASCRAILGENHPLILITIYNSSFELSKLGNLSDGLSLMKKVGNCLAEHPVPTRDWLRLVENITQIFFRAAKSDQNFDWSLTFQSLSLAFIKVLDLHSVEQATTLRNSFRLFHNRYLQLCLDYDRSDLLLSIVSAIQGRRLAAILLEELTARVADEITEDAPLRDRVLALRRRLRFAALDLRVLDGGLSRSGVMDGSLRGFQGDSDEHATQRQQLAEYAALFQRYHQSFQELVKNDPDFALVSPVLDIDLAKLQEKLATDEALVLLLDWPDAESPKLFSLVVKSKTHRLFALPEALLALPAQFDALGQVQTARLGVRHSAMRSSSPISSAIIAPITLGEIVAVLEQHFWGTLALELTEIKTVHVVTHGDFHVLPFSAAADPNRWSVFTYPGLIFYQHQHYQRQTSQGLAEKSTPTMPLVVQTYSAMDHGDYPPIPMVDAEAQLITAIWPNVQSTLILNDASIAVLHLAGHGHYASNDPLSAGVLLASATIDCRVVFKSGLRPQIVVLSACVVGRTHEADGEPLGLVSAFLLRGARFVIAPLMPINDCMMPMLVCLFYQAWLDGRTPPQALTEAKRRLSTGDWYPDTAQRVRSAYKNTLNAYLAILLNEPHAHRQYQLLETFRQWPLPDPYKSDGRNLLVRRLQSERGIERFIDAFLNHIEIHRAELPVVDLVTSVVGFGG